MSSTVVLKTLEYRINSRCVSTIVYAMFPGWCCVFSGTMPAAHGGPNTICCAEEVIAAIAEAEALDLRGFRIFYSLQTSIEYGMGIPNGKFAFQRVLLDANGRASHWETVPCPPHIIAAFSAQIGEPSQQVSDILFLIHNA
ncbi:MAG: hypothetical protein WC497_05765 [Patescibacteria group bacterium]